MRVAPTVGLRRSKIPWRTNLWLTTAETLPEPILYLGEWARERNCPTEFPWRPFMLDCSCAKSLNAKRLHSLNTSTSKRRDQPHCLAANYDWETSNNLTSAQQLAPMESLLAHKSDYILTTSASTPSPIRRFLGRKFGGCSDPELVLEKIIKFL